MQNSANQYCKVSGVQFSALDGDVLKAAIERHQQVRRHTLTRAAAKEQFGYGKMIPRGKRVPSGGRRGDTYTYYPDTRINNEDPTTIRMIFNQALVRLES